MCSSDLPDHFEHARRGSSSRLQRCAKAVPACHTANEHHERPTVGGLCGRSCAKRQVIYPQDTEEKHGHHACRCNVGGNRTAGWPKLANCKVDPWDDCCAFITPDDLCGLDHFRRVRQRVCNVFKRHGYCQAANQRCYAFRGAGNPSQVHVGGQYGINGYTFGYHHRLLNIDCRLIQPCLLRRYSSKNRIKE